MTASTVTYVNADQFRPYIHDDTTNDLSVINGCLLAASRAVDAWCDRHFYQVTATRYISPCTSTYWVLPLGHDLATTTGLTVTSEFGNAGTYTDTWTLNTDFLVEPVNQMVGGVEGWPYTSFRAIGGKIWPPRYIEWMRDTVKVVGTWGWPSVPDAVKQATLILAVDLYKLGDAPFGVAGFGQFGAVRVRDNPRAAAMLQPYKKADSLLMA